MANNSNDSGCGCLLFIMIIVFILVYYGNISISVGENKFIAKSPQEFNKELEKSK